MAAILLLLACVPEAQAACSFVSVSGSGFYTSFSDGSDVYGYVLPAGGSGTVTLLFTGAGCTWQLYDDGATNTSGITFNPSSLGGTSAGTTVTLSVTVGSAAAAGVNSGQRSAQWFIMVNGQVSGTVNFLQNSSSCSLSFSPASVSVPASGGSGGINAVTPYGCWFAYNFAPASETWFSGTYLGYPMDGSHPIGSLDLAYTVAANSTNAVRTATLNILQPNSATFTVTQAAGTSSSVTLIATPASITVTSPVNGLNITQTVNFTSSSSSTPVNITNVTDDATAAWDYGTWAAGPTPSSMSIVFYPAGLNVGTYTDTFVVTSSASNSPLRIPVTFNIVGSSSGPPALQLSTNSVSGSGSIGATTNLTPTPVSITSANSTQISFTASTQTSNSIGPNWLTVSLGGGASGSANGTTPASLTIFANLQGFAPGTYSGRVTITPTSPSSNGPQAINVTVTASGTDSLQLQWNPTSSAAQTMQLTTSPSALNGIVQVSSQNTAIPPLYFTVSSTVISPPGGNWLQVSPTTQQQTNATVMVSVQPAGLTFGTYQGEIDFLDTSKNGTPLYVVLNVVSNVVRPALVASPPALTLQSTPNGSAISQTISLTSSDPSTAVTFQSVTDDGVAWLQGNLHATLAAGGTFITPGSLNITVNPANLTSGQPSTDVLNVNSDASNSPLAIPITLNIAGPSTQTISHIADGGGWKTTINLVNMDTQPAQFAVNFWKEDGTAFSVPLAAGSAAFGTIPPGGAQTIETAGVGSNLLEGWAEVVSNQQIGGTAIFRDIADVQEAAVPLLTSGGSKVVIPFDSGGQLAIGVALANASQTTDAQITMTMRDEQGRTIPMTITDPQGGYSKTAVTSMTLAKHSHRAFNAQPLNATGEVRGVIEFDSPNGPIFALGIRSVNNRAFTSIDAVTPQPAATRTISHIADGGGWKTTINLVNMDTQPAQFAVNFWKEDGTAFPVPLAAGSAAFGTIPPGGAQTIETAGVGGNLLEGWAEVVSNQQIGGTAIFRDIADVQEAAVPLLTSGGSKVVIPFDSGGQLAIGVALANASQTADAQITMTMRDEQGRTIPMTITGPQGGYSKTAVTSMTLAKHSHRAFNAQPLNATGEVRGVIEFDSPNVPIFALGIRSVNNSAFTSIRALTQ